MSVMTLKIEKPQKPVKPLKPFKLYRRKRIAQQEPSETIFKIIKQEWRNLDKGVKEKMQLQYELQYNKYLEEKEEWQDRFGALKLMEKEKSKEKSKRPKVQSSKGGQWEKEESKKRLKKINTQKDQQETQIDFQISSKFKLPKQNNKKQQVIGQQMIEDYKDQQLIVDKKQQKGAGHLISKMHDKVNMFKNRLSFKHLDQDFKYKKHIKQKLKELDQIQEINLIVDIPKVLGGKNAHLQGALFLKNCQSKQNLPFSQIVTKDSQQQIPKDRKSFYQVLGKELKLKKSQIISQSALKQCFKQSSLDENDILDHQDSINMIKQGQKAKQSKMMNKKQRRKSNLSEQSNDSRKSIDILQYQCKQESKSNTEKIQQFQQSKGSQNENSLDKIHQQTKKETVKKTKKKKKSELRKYLKDFIQQQAENSGEQDNNQESSQEDGNTDVSSLIDNDLQISEKDQILIHNKFVSDMIEKEEREYENMRKKLQQKYLEEEENLKKRMKQAAKKNAQKQKQEQKSLNVFKQEQILVEGEQNQNESCTANNNKKLKQLQIQLGIKPKETKKLQQKSLPLISNIAMLQKAMLPKKKGDFKKPMRGGMKNLIQVKGFQANIKIKEKR